MKVAVTGAAGFLGWHVRCAARAQGIDVVAVDRNAMSDPARLASDLAEVDSVIHLAGVNRANDYELREVNEGLARLLVNAIGRAERAKPPVVVYGNSIQSGNGSPFGAGKMAAAEVLQNWGLNSGAVVVDVRLPNLFGEHGRPFYNSVFATFAHQLAQGETPKVMDDRTLTLVSAQDAADELLAAASSCVPGVVEIAGDEVGVAELLKLMQRTAAGYEQGLFPSLVNRFEISLFNAFRSHRFAVQPAIPTTVHSDARGQLFECAKAPLSGTQVFFSTTFPGQTRGNHFHRRKIERFIVLEGEALIRLRRLFFDEVVQVRVSGTTPVLVDMPSLWTHSIENVGDSPLLTLFWANEVFDPVNSDTHMEAVLRIGSLS